MNKVSSFRPSRRASLRRAALGLSTVTVVAAACGGGHKKAAATTSSSTTAAPTTLAPTTTTLPPTWPLTGLPAKSSSQTHIPAVVVKIDNIGQARPQAGVTQADIVYDTMVEGGLTRLAAIFQSSYPTLLGPVRSGRLTDEGVSDNLNHPLLVFAGTNADFMPILQAQPVTLVTMDNYPGLFQRIGNNAPHNLFTNVANMVKVVNAHSWPAPLFNYLQPGQSFGGAGVTPASSVSFSFPASSVSWNYDPAGHVWKRIQDGTPDVVQSGAQITAANVVIYFVPYITSGMATGEGLPPAPIPEGILTGTGNAWVFSGGKLVKGTWTRPKLLTPATYKDSAGAPIKLAPGKTWIELAPVGTLPSVTP